MERKIQSTEEGSGTKVDVKKIDEKESEEYLSKGKPKYKANRLRSSKIVTRNFNKIREEAK